MSGMMGEGGVYFVVALLLAEALKEQLSPLVIDGALPLGLSGDTQAVVRHGPLKVRGRSSCTPTSSSSAIFMSTVGSVTWSTRVAWLSQASGLELVDWLAPRSASRGLERR